MALGDFLRKQFIDVIQWTESGPGVLMYRFPMQDMEIQSGGQLTVRDSQLAIFVNEGRAADMFTPGLHTLVTANLPLLTNLQNWGTSILKGIAGDAFGALGSIGTLIIAGSVFIFGVIFFLMAPQTIWGWLMNWIPKNLRTHIDVSGRIAWDSIAGYTRGIVVIAFLDATLVFVGLLILQVPLAPALAAVVFLGAFIPVIGAPIATFFAAIVALAENGPVTALLVIVLTIIVGSFDGDVMQPLVMGKAVNLHPLAIVIVIAAGSIALGIVGALIAVPVAGAIYGVAKYVTGRDQEHPYKTTEPFDHSTA